MSRAAVDVQGLSVALGGVALVDGVSFALEAGQVHGLVGESGSGKTTVANALLRLLPPGAEVRGAARVGDVDLLSLDARAMARARGRLVAMVPQEPLAALNPVMTVGAHLLEVLEVHHGLPRPEGRRRALALLEEVGLPEPAARLASYPHQLSGGMRQRVLLAAALACEPAVLIADEPTTALDASLRGLVLALLRRLAEGRRLAVLLISHDLPAVREVCRDVSVLYAGRLVEQGPAEDVFLQPRHPYTRALLDARPAGVPRGVALRALPGVVPGAADVVPGCRFHPRCAEARARCREDVPTWTAGTTALSCHFPLAPPVASPTPAVREGAG